VNLLRTSLVLVSFVVAGCSQSSNPSPRFNDAQGVLSSAGHWQVLALTTADRIVDYLEGVAYSNGASKKDMPSAVVSSKPLYVRPGDPGMIFSRTFHEDLKTVLLDRGWTVTDSSKDALSVDTGIELIPRDGNVAPKEFPGTFSALAYGVWALNSFTIARVFGAGGLADVINNNRAQGGAQVNITTTLMDGDLYLLRKTSSYYIEDADIRQYAGTMPSARPVAPHDVEETPPAVETFKVVDE